MGALALPAGLAAWWLLQDGGSELPMPKALRAAGASVDARLRLRTFGVKGAGLFTSAPVAAGEVLITIPARAVLSGKLGREVLGHEGLDEEAALCALLCEGRREAESGRDPLGLMEYLKAMPRSFHGLPLSLTLEEAEDELRGTALLPAFRALRERSEEQRAAVLKACGEKLESPWSEERWLWAKAAVLTRAGPSLQIEHRVEGDEEEGCVAMVPLVDFANCSAEPSAQCQLGAAGEVKLVALRDLRAGAEVNISYGEQSQEQLLFTFGFALPQAKLAATSPLAFQSQESPLRNALLQLLAMDRGSGGGLPSAQLSWEGERGSRVCVAELWAAANILQMPDEELQKVKATVVEAGGHLPAGLGERLSPQASGPMRGLLEAWLGELTQPTGGRGGRRVAALRAYRQECRKLVEAALARLEAE